MPKFYCDYCDVFLTNDSISVRKLHCKGWRHKTNVRAFFAQFVGDPTSALMVSTQQVPKEDAKEVPSLMIGVQPEQMMMGVPLLVNGMLVQNGVILPNPSASGTMMILQNNLSNTNNNQTIQTSSTTTTSSSAASNPTQHISNNVLHAIGQMTKTPENSIPPFPDTSFKPPFADENSQQPNWFLFPPPPPPHLINLCPNIPLTGSYQQTAPSPPFPYMLQKQKVVN